MRKTSEKYYDYTVENMRVPCGYIFPVHSMALITLNEVTGNVTLGLNPQCGINFTQYTKPYALSLYCDNNGATSENLLKTGRCVLNFVNKKNGALYKLSDLHGDECAYGKYVQQADIVYLCSVVLDTKADRVIGDVRHYTLGVDKVYVNSRKAFIAPDGEFIFDMHADNTKRRIDHLKSIYERTKEEIHAKIQEDVDENMLVYLASNINPNIYLTQEACTEIIASSFKNKKRALNKCVRWCVRNNIHLLTENEVGMALGNND